MKNKGSITLSISEWKKVVEDYNEKSAGELMVEMKNDWEKLQSSMPKSESLDEKLAESLDEIETEEEFLAKPSLVDDGSCLKILTAKIHRTTEEDNWYEDLLLFDENKKLVKEIPVFSHSHGWRDAESQAKDFAYSIHSEIDWTQC